MDTNSLIDSLKNNSKNRKIIFEKLDKFKSFDDIKNNMDDFKALNKMEEETRKERDEIRKELMKKLSTTKENKMSLELKGEFERNINVEEELEKIPIIYKNSPVYESKDDAEKNISNYIPNSVVPNLYYLVPEVPTIKVNYHKNRWPWLVEMEKIDKGDFIDLRAAEEYELKQGEFKLINLGISVQLPKGYHAEVVPRSSTYKNFGIIMSNSIGIIDESYCGDNDIWKFPAIAMRDTIIRTNDRICQFRIVKNRDINIEVVDKLGNEDRGGIGSTGTK